MKKINVAILGYGNLGKATVTNIKKQNDMNLFGVFTRRNPKTLDIDNDINVFTIDEILSYKNDIDVLILCGGSAKDLPIQSPLYAENFNIVDSFDNHNKILNHFENVDKAAISTEHTAIISAGWDPGLFSLNRVLFESILSNGKTYTFWGDGISQGHSDAIRRIDGVVNAVQYTIPIKETLEKVRNNETENFTKRQMHKRKCYVAIKDNANKKEIETEIKNMPDYFADYDTEVIFTTNEDIVENHKEMPHGGFVIRNGQTGKDNENNELMEFSLKLKSNPQFTSSVLVACARALYRLKEKKDYGAKTMLDIPVSMFSEKTTKEILTDLM